MKEMIKAEHVTMRFRMANDRITSIKEFLIQLVKGKMSYREQEALSDVSLTLYKGEVTGLIGHNGAGKSTLLKIISRIMKQTEGNVVVSGNVVPMLELGSGFDMDMTGRENLFLNGAILGYSEEYLKERYDDIIAFSELTEDQLMMPLRNYSSGMITRLAFSIATMVKPEILIVDEVLAVGDMEFQKKSMKRMMELMSGGATVLFVSHDIAQIRKLCANCIWLDHGKVKMFGKSETVCDAYEAYYTKPHTPETQSD